MALSKKSKMAAKMAAIFIENNKTLYKMLKHVFLLFWALIVDKNMKGMNIRTYSIQLDLTSNFYVTDLKMVPILFNFEEKYQPWALSFSELIAGVCRLL